MDKKNLFLLSIVVLTGIAATLFAYRMAKESYKAVGYNDGTIIQRYEIIEKLKKIKKLESCPPSSNELIEFISVKAISVYAIKRDDGHISFCIIE